jgi:hypothetical protein
LPRSVALPRFRAAARLGRRRGCEYDNAYLIDGDTNYLQLREFAEKLNGTASQFNAYWDSALSSAVIEPGKPYTGVK